VLLRMSSLFLRTLREDPADAEVPSHRLLVRAGYIRRAAPGGYSWLPLGWLVLRNIERIVREEMDREGFQEVHFPALLPKEPYDRTNRWTEYGDDLFRLKDRKGADFLLGPTHEEMFTLLVKDLYSSYKDLPLSIYQIQWKFRDEPRPRAGLLRGREFLMKDSYSFDVDDAGLQSSYDRHRTAYIRTFDRLGLSYVIVAAMSGAMGGSASEEFLAVADVGEDTYVRCTTCDYAANTEAVRTPAPDAIPYDDAPAAHVEDTPDTPTIETLVALSNDRADLRRADRDWTAADTLKNVVVKLVHPDGRSEPLAIGVPGDREVDTKRLGAQVHPALVEPFTDADFAAHRTLVRGYIGPQSLGRDSKSGVRYLVDPRVVEGTRWITGATTRAVTSTTSSRGATSPLTARSRPRRSGRVTRAPTVTARSRWRAASRWATSSSSGASSPRRSTSRCSTRTASRSWSPWARTASASPAPSPPLPSRRTTSSACAGPARSRRPTCTSWRPARTTPSSRRPGAGR
jgi:prolyl-tRNA synthetase